MGITIIDDFESRFWKGGMEMSLPSRKLERAGGLAFGKGQFAITSAPGQPLVLCVLIYGSAKTVDVHCEEIEENSLGQLADLLRERHQMLLDDADEAANEMVT